MTFLRLFFCTIATSLLLPAGTSLATAATEPQPAIKEARERQARIPPYPRNLLYDQGRPANFFRAGYYRDTSKPLCSKVLDALNDPRAYPRSAFGKTFSLRKMQQVYTANKYEIDWKNLGGFNSHFYSGTITDIDNDGEAETVYRLTHAYKDIWNGIIYSDILPDPNPGIKYDDALRRWGGLSRKNLERIKKEYETSGVYHPFRWQKKLRVDKGKSPYSFVGWVSYGQFATILALSANHYDTKRYLLIGGSVNSANPFHPVPMRLFEIIDKQPKLHCEFEPRFRY